MRRGAITSTVVVFALAFAASLSMAAAAAAAEPGPATGSLWNSFIAWIFEQQRAFHRQLIAALEAIRKDGGLVAAGGLVLASFLYGVFHAAGPGHGKAVITTYLLTNRERLRRGVLLAVAAAFCQGVVAIVLVYGLIYVAGWLPRETSGAVSWSERLSYLLVLLLGIFLVWRAGRAVFAIILRRFSERQHGAADPHCGHSHGPTADQIAQAADLRSSLGVVLAIGIRPCSGAIIVLVFAKAIGFAWAGIGSVAAMSIGTALTVSALAFLAVSLRNRIAATAERFTGGWYVTGEMVRLAGGATLALIGISLLTMSFTPKHPLGL